MLRSAIDELKESINRKVEELIDERLSVRAKPEPDNRAWDRAPEWARFWARDPDGNAWFFERQPKWGPLFEEWNPDGGSVVIDQETVTVQQSRNSLLQRGSGQDRAPEIDWEQAPDWAQWAAMDENREWHWFGVRPEPEAGQWGGFLNNVGMDRWAEMHPAPEQDCDWTRSLVGRPDPVVAPCPVIDWSRAPEWARYAAVDPTGERWFYEERPEWDEDADEWNDKFPNGRVRCGDEGLVGVDYRQSLVERPRPNPWSEDPDYPVSDWQYEVQNSDTRLGYREWVEHQREAHDQDPD